jgi:hypothetical protein
MTMTSSDDVWKEGKKKGRKKEKELLRFPSQPAGKPAFPERQTAHARSRGSSSLARDPWVLGEAQKPRRKGKPRKQIVLPLPFFCFRAHFCARFLFAGREKGGETNPTDPPMADQQQQAAFAEEEVRRADAEDAANKKRHADAMSGGAAGEQDAELAELPLKRARQEGPEGADADGPSGFRLPQPMRRAAPSPQPGQPVDLLDQITLPSVPAQGGLSIPGPRPRTGHISASMTDLPSRVGGLTSHDGRRQPTGDNLTAFQSFSFSLDLGAGDFSLEDLHLLQSAAARLHEKQPQANASGSNLNLGSASAAPDLPVRQAVHGSTTRSHSAIGQLTSLSEVKFDFSQHG